MTRSTILKKERKLRLVQNSSKLRRTKINVKRDTRMLQNALISEKDQSKSNEQFVYKTRSFSGPSRQKSSNFLKKQSIDDNKNVNDYYQIIHNSFLLELMKQTICVSCKVMWNGDMSISKREGTVYCVFSGLKLEIYIHVLGLYCSLVFTCRCSHEIKINTSKQCVNTSKRDINIRSAIGEFIVNNLIIDIFV